LSTNESDSVDAQLNLPRPVWAELVTGGTTLTTALSATDVTVYGDQTTLESVLGCFDNILI
jgi:alkyl sulfatase BDS1-like metallo-beta-lactamase superfamily hydrolase